jgi:mono/diheme cytochrome c family protein
VIAAAFFTRPKLTAVERGRRLAEANGCFACHGPEGTRGTENPGREDGAVPSYGSLMMYADSPEEVREWIATGTTLQRMKSETWKEQRDKGALKMPAFGGRLSKQEIDDLVAFVRAVASDPAPEDSLALAGRDRAGELVCVGCHGEGGRYARRNPGSLKGYVPPWDGDDFPELVKNEAEFREWVEHGVSRRFEKNRLARFFLDRAPLRMPAYEGKLEPGDLEALWAYITWLRKSG